MNPLRKLEIPRSFTTARGASAWLGFVLLTGLACAKSDRESPELAHHRNAGKARFENGETDQAIVEFQECVRLSRSNDDKLRLAKALFLGQRFDEAIILFRELAPKMESVADVPYNLGIIYKRLGKTEEAVAQLEKVVKLDGTCVPAWFNLGVMYARAGRNAEAQACLDTVLARDAFHAAAYYQRAALLRSAGHADEAQASFTRFQTLRETIPSDRLTSEALEESKYFEIDVREPQRTASANTPSAPPAMKPLHLTPADLAIRVEGSRASTLADVDGDGDPDYLVVDERTRLHEGAILHVFLNDGSGGAQPPSSFALAVVHVETLLTADLDNDGDLDVLAAGLRALDIDHDGDVDAVGAPASQLFRNETPPGRGVALSSDAKTGLIDGVGGHALLAWDYDHDGDLDVLAARAAPPRTALLRNNGSPRPEDPITFTEVTDDAGLEGVAIEQALARDFDGDGDTDLAVVTSGRTLRFYGNAGHGRLERAGTRAADGVSASAMAVGDATGDGWEDLVVLAEASKLLLVNQGAFAFDRHPLPVGASAARSAPGGSESTVAGAPLAGERFPTLADVDSDGDLDLLVRGRYYENDGTGAFTDETVRAGLDGGEARFDVADLDADGDLDLFEDRSTSFRILRNDGTGGSFLRLALEGGKSNRTGVGAVVDVQDGTFFVRRTLTATPLEIGVGARTHLDYVRVAWPSLIVQNEIDVDLAKTPHLVVKEKPQPLGSCPALYAWDGSRHRFVTDVLATASLGLVLAGDTPMAFDDEELIKLPRDGLAAEQGEYHLAITEELNELVYVDDVQLLAVDHPPDVVVYSNTILRDPPFPAADLVFVRNERPPVSVLDQDHADHRDDVTACDGWYAAAFTGLKGAFHGMTEPHSLTMDLGPNVNPSACVLVINAWMDWPETATFLSVAQNDSIDLELPKLDVETPQGWRTIHAGFGVQALKPKDVVVDLRGLLRPGEHVVRMTTNLACYWDRIAVADALDEASVPVTRRATGPVRADLQFHGWSGVFRPDTSPLLLYDYDRVSLKAPWAGSTGSFTRYGDVLPLLRARDDLFVIFNTGDGVTFAFDASMFPSVTDHTTPSVRDYFLRVTGFEKQADYGTLASARVEPLPFRAMSRYPYGKDERYPSDPEHEAYVRTYNTRVVEARPFAGGRIVERLSSASAASSPR